MSDQIFGYLLNFSGPLAYWLIFAALMACGLGVPLPEDISLFAAGLLSYYQSANVHIMVIVSMIGVLLGDSIMYFLGHKYGEHIRKKRPFSIFLTDDKFAGLQERFQKKGNKVIFAGRFMPGLRAPIFFTAGSLHLPYKVFLFYDGLAAMLSVPAIIYSVWYFGEHVDSVIKIVKQVQFGIVGSILAIVLLLVFRYYMKKKARKNGSIHS